MPFVTKLDCSAVATVVTCALCSWRAGPTSRHTAAELATAHRRDQHTGAALVPA